MLDDGKFWDALTFFQMHDLDVLLLAETGVTAGTHISLVPQFPVISHSLHGRCLAMG